MITSRIRTLTNMNIGFFASQVACYDQCSHVKTIIYGLTAINVAQLISSVITDEEGSASFDLTWKSAAANNLVVALTLLGFAKALTDITPSESNTSFNVNLMLASMAAIIAGYLLESCINTSERILGFKK